MICEQVRELIDLGDDTTEVSMHLRGCTPCRLHQAETSSLLSLLSVQPRVKAPADFDARLQARLASEEVKVATMLSSLPAIAAPANFDFQLRSRLAQAKVGEQQAGLLTWVEQFFAQSFSLGQAATAMVAVALIVTVSVVQFNRSGNPTQASPTNQGGMIALSSTSNLTPTVESPSAFTPTVANDIVDKPAVNESKPRAVRHVSQVVNRSNAAATGFESKLIASAVSERVIINAKTGQEMKLTTNNIAYGQQLARFVPAPKIEPMSEVF